MQNQTRAFRPLLTTLLLTLIISTPLAAEVSGDMDQAREGWALIEQGALVIDVRSSGEFEAGHLPGAVHVPYEDLEALMDTIGSDKTRSVVVYCGSGRRAGVAQNQLADQGYSAVFNASGFDALQATDPNE